MRLRRRLKDPTQKGGGFAARLAAPPKYATVRMSPGDSGETPGNCLHLCVSRTQGFGGSTVNMYVMLTHGSLTFGATHFAINIDLGTYLKAG